MKMKALQRFVVLLLLGVWSFPAVSLAQTAPAPSAPVSAETRRPPQARAVSDAAGEESTALAARERQSQDLQDFRGGGIYVYVGSGALLIAVIVLLLLLV